MKRSLWSYIKDPDYERTYFVRERHFRGNEIGVVQADFVDDFTGKATAWSCTLHDGRFGTGRTRDEAVSAAREAKEATR